MSLYIYIYIYRFIICFQFSSDDGLIERRFSDSQAELALPELLKEVDIRSMFINFSGPIVFHCGLFPLSYSGKCIWYYNLFFF